VVKSGNPEAALGVRTKSWIYMKISGNMVSAQIKKNGQLLIIISLMKEMR